MISDWTSEAGLAAIVLAVLPEWEARVAGETGCERSSGRGSERRWMMNLEQQVASLKAERAKLREAMRRLLRIAEHVHCECLRMPCSHVIAITRARHLLNMGRRINAGPG